MANANYLRRLAIEPLESRWAMDASDPVGGDAPVADESVSEVATPSMWTNQLNLADINDDGVAVAGDILVLINYLNRRGAGELSDKNLVADLDSSQVVYPDANGDGFVSPMDVMVALNILNGRDADEAFAQLFPGVDRGPEILPVGDYYYCPFFDNQRAVVQLQLTPYAFERYMAGNDSGLSRLLAHLEFRVASAENNMLKLWSYRAFYSDSEPFIPNANLPQLFLGVNGIETIQNFKLKDVRGLDIPTTCV